jgi:hypothetical protein
LSGGNYVTRIARKYLPNPRSALLGFAARFQRVI